MQYLLGFLTVSLLALPVYGQTLSDFRDFILSPLATQAANEQADAKRNALTKAMAEAQFNRLSWAGFPIVKDFAPLLDAASGQPTSDQLVAFHQVILQHLNAQTKSRAEQYAADLLLKTKTEPGGVFAVCDQKIARRWKANAGNFERLADSPC
ncbi:MAG: hypothetical protein Q7U76_11355 [Nitrospirota bacterium]|nr:hypothetical protein [Nitrospirota bacterium]